MALVLKDRVRESSSTSGTGTITLAGAATGFDSFASIGDGNTTYYAIIDTIAGDWEVGLGTYTASGTTLSRDTVLESSNSDTLVNFAANSKDVICTYPADKSVFLAADGSLTLPGALSATGAVTGSNLNVSNWDTAYGWGDHSTVGYLTSYTETDPVYTASSWYTTTNNSSNWNTAYGWGDHASAGYLVSTGDTMTGDLSFGDNNKAIFGTGSDLQIFHDGSVSKIAGPNVFRISSNDGSRGSVQISAPNSGTGGEIRSVTYGNNFYLDSDDTYKQDSTAIGGSLIEMTATNGNYGEFYFKAKQDPDSGGAVATRMVIDSSGDVGIGTATPSTALDVNGTVTANGLDISDANPIINFTDTTNNFDAYISAENGNLELNSDSNNESGSVSTMSFKVDNTERMRIDSNGNVGIGTNSPTALFHTNKQTAGDTTDSIWKQTWNASWGIELEQQHVSGSHIQWNWKDVASNNLMTWKQGNVGIGNTSPSTKLDVTGDVTVTGTLNVRTAIDLADNDILRFGTGDDCELFCNGSHMYMDLNAGIGNFYIRDGTTTRYTFDDNGSFTATGDVTAYSDERLKENWCDLPEGFVESLAGVKSGTYNRIDLDGKKQVGVSAQSLQTLLPDAVIESDDTLAVNYGNAALASSIELAKKVVELEARIKELESK